MSTVRLRRLQADYETVRRLVHQHPRIELEGVSGDPPEKYRFVLHVASLRQRADGVVRAFSHQLEVTMPRGYPRDPPLCRMLTPVFHPNVAPHAVCVGDHWTAAESLAALIQRVGEMLAFQSYNTKSPLNGRAAQWVAENIDELPVDAEEFFIDLVAPEEPVRVAAPAPTVAGVAAPPCANCGEPALAGACEAGHALCPDCQIVCETCGRTLCLVCGQYPCPVCAAEHARRF